MDIKDEKIVLSEEFFEYEGNKSGDEYWRAQDVCETLGYTDVAQTMSELESDEAACLPFESESGKVQNPEWFVNDSGLFDLLMRSEEPIGKTFRRWVSHDALRDDPNPFMYTHEKAIKEDLADLCLLPMWANF